jgi:hypothetical protein
MLGRTNLAIGKTGDFPSSEFRVGPATKQHRHRARSEQPLLRTASFQCWRRAARPWLCLRSVKCGNATTEVIWVDPVAETGLRTGAFVAKCGDRSSEDKCPGDRSRTCRIGLQRRSMYTLQVWPLRWRSLFHQRIGGSQPRLSSIRLPESLLPVQQQDWFQTGSEQSSRTVEGVDQSAVRALCSGVIMGQDRRVEYHFYLYVQG